MVCIVTCLLRLEEKNHRINNWLPDTCQILIKSIKKITSALAGVTPWLECWPLYQRVKGSILVKGTRGSKVQFQSKALTCVVGLNPTPGQGVASNQLK